MKTINLGIYNDDHDAGAYDARVSYAYEVTGDENISVHLYHMKLFLQSMGYVISGDLAIVDDHNEVRHSSDEIY